MFQMLPDMPLAAKFFAAFVIVLALIALTAWIVRRFGASRLSGGARGRQPRLAVIDAASVDGRRRLVLIRRDNVEHLMMIGGPTDVVIEPNIVRAAAARDVPREPARPATDAVARPVPLQENGGAWPLQPSVEPPPTPPMQPTSRGGYRAPVTDEPWVAPEPHTPRETAPREPSLRARPADSLSGMAASEFASKLNADPPPPPRMAPVPPPPPLRESPPVPPSPPQTDRNLAEMAQRLEAALRRPNASEFAPPVTDPLAAAPPAPPVKAVEPMREIKTDPMPDFKAEPKFDLKIEPKAEPKVELKVEPKVDGKAKNPFDSLEEEMASLLGRSGKS